MAVGSRRRMVAAACVLLALLLAAGAIWLGTVQLNHNARKGVAERLMDASDSVIHHVRLYFQNIMYNSDSMADCLALNEDITGEQAMALLSVAAEDMHAYELTVTRTDGVYASLSGRRGAIDAHDVRTDASISDVFTDEATGIPSVCVTTPIMRDGKSVGTLAGKYDIRELAERVSVPLLGGQGYFHVFQPDGKYVLRSPQAARLMGDASFYAIRGAQFASGYDYDRLTADISAGRSGTVIYTASDGTDMLGYYTSLGINNWYMICLAPVQFWTRFAEENIYVLMMTVLAVALLIIGLGAALLGMDITRQRDNARRLTGLSALNARQTAALANLDAPAFVFDAHSMAARPLDADDRSNAWLMERILIPDHAGEVVAPCDEAAYLKFCDALLTARGRMTGEFRLRLAPGEPVRLYRVTLNASARADGRPDTVVTMVDMDDVARRMEELRLRASFDELSGLDTFSEFRIKARALLNRPMHHAGAVAFIHADNADAAMDSAPDVPRSAVIRQCGEFVMEAMRDCDVFARGLGFEFWVFSGDQTGTEIIQKGMNRILDSRLGAGEVKLTFSCGISRADPGDGIDDLIERARGAAHMAHVDGGHRVQHG